MIAYILFPFYLFLGIIVLRTFIRRNIYPFNIYHTSAILIFKVFMGCLYGYVFLHYYGGDDTWHYFNDSKSSTDQLLTNPGQFFRDFTLTHSLSASNSLFQNMTLYIYYFEGMFIDKFLAVLNLFSGKNYYVDVLLFELLMIPGPLLLFKMLAADFPKKTGMFFLLVFFIPSVIFWNSGIRAEAFIFLFMILTIYNGQAYSRKPGGKAVAGMLAGLTGLLLFRFQFLLVFLPAFAAYLISLRKKTTAPYYFVLIYMILGLIFIGSLFLPVRYQFSQPIIKSQQSFFKLTANTRYTLDSLQPGPVSFIKVLPRALANTLLRPYPWEGKSLLQSLSSIDVIFMLAGLIYFMLWRERKKEISHPVFWLFLFYGLSQMILIGYAVPFPGAIVRYRSILFLFIILFFYSGNPYLEQKIRYRIFKIH
jgi:hypothetical protein